MGIILVGYEHLSFLPELKRENHHQHQCVFGSAPRLYRHRRIQNEVKLVDDFYIIYFTVIDSCRRVGRENEGCVLAP